MTKTSYLGLSLLLIVALASPGLSQVPQPKSKGEYDAYMGFFSEKDPKKKAELGEKFLADFKDTEFKKDSHLLLIRAYVEGKNCPKVMEVSDRYASLPGMANDSKVNFFVEALNCAQESGDITKIVGYGDKILALDPNNLNAQLILATTIPERLPTDAAQKEAALTKAEGLANKAVAGVQKLGAAQGVSDAQKNELLGQLHSSLGLIHLTRKNYDKAIPEFQEAIKTAPKEWGTRYNLGLSYQAQMPEASKQYQAAVDAENAARRDNADRVLQDELQAKREGLESSIRDLREKAIEQFAFGVAIGGNTTAKPALDQLQKLYQQKTGSLDGLDALINEKKTQLASRG